MLDTIIARAVALNESRMRAWKYLPELRRVAYDYYYNKPHILGNADKWDVYNVGGVPIFIGGERLFRQVYPKLKDVKGYTTPNNEVVMWVDEDDTYEDIVRTLAHELEHVIDLTNAPQHFNNEHQRIIWSLVYEESADQTVNAIVRPARELIYRVWSDTEANAYVSDLLDEEDLAGYFENLRTDLAKVKNLSSAHIERSKEFWNRLSSICPGQTPHAAWKCFIRRTADKIIRLERNYQRKLKHWIDNRLRY